MSSDSQGYLWLSCAGIKLCGPAINQNGKSNQRNYVFFRQVNLYEFCNFVKIKKKTKQKQNNKNPNHKHQPKPQTHKTQQNLNKVAKNKTVEKDS